MTHPYITTKDLAVELGVHRATVIRWIHAGIIPAKRIGPRTFRIIREEIRAVLNR